MHPGPIRAGADPRRSAAAATSQYETRSGLAAREREQSSAADNSLTIELSTPLVAQGLARPDLIT
jgi:hypothetical protein